MHHSEGTASGAGQPSTKDQGIIIVKGTGPMGPGHPRRPTLRTIADLCGLGVPTVSRALNDSPEIGEETKRRIRQIAEEVGYIPDRAGLRLRTGQTSRLAWSSGSRRTTR